MVKKGTITAPESEIIGSQHENRPPGSKPYRHPSHMWYMVVSEGEEQTEMVVHVVMVSIGQKVGGEGEGYMT